jgi:hypothetical protein
MIGRILSGIFGLALMVLSGCTTIVGGDGNGNGDGGDDARYAVFVDPENPDFSTTDVYDVDGDIVRFDIENHAVFWVADGRTLDEGTWVLDGYVVVGRGYQIRFGTDDGVRRAYISGVASENIYQSHFHADSFDFDPTSTPIPND